MAVDAAGGAVSDLVRRQVGDDLMAVEIEVDPGLARPPFRASQQAAIEGAGLGEIAEAFGGVSIGSYPSFGEGRFKNNIVVRGKDGAQVSAALAAVSAMLEKLRAAREQG